MIQNPTYRGVVHPWHCDHMGHMNVMHYVGKFDEASWNYFSMIGLSAKRMEEANTGLAAVQQNITYKREFRVGETLYVNTRAVKISGKVMSFTHEMMNGERHDLCALCELTVAHMDAQARKATPFPDDVVEAVEAVIKAGG